MQFIPMALMAVSTVLTAAGQIKEGRRAKDVGWANAKVLEAKGNQAFASKAREAQLTATVGRYDGSAALAKGASMGAGSSESFINSFS